MQYRLHDASPELWSWVKATAYLEGKTVNDYILYVLNLIKTDTHLPKKLKSRVNVNYEIIDDPNGKEVL